ncbi:hypothetical protein D1007_19044 [Hordeum vulgare]|nr:hypothetical protein D1007_19044 [Hordeum vulgare]
MASWDPRTTTFYFLLFLIDGGMRGRVCRRVVDLREASFFLRRRARFHQHWWRMVRSQAREERYDTASSMVATMPVSPCSPTCRPGATRHPTTSWLGAASC